MSAEQKEVSYTQKQGVWYAGCGCGQKAADRLTLGEGTAQIFIHRPGDYTGPASGFKYHVRPTTVSLDIDSRDAAVWLADGTAREAVPGFKGRMARLP